MRFRPGSKAIHETPMEWLHEVRVAFKHVHNMEDAKHIFVAFFVPHWVLRIWRRL